MHIERLAREHEAAVQSLLLADPEVNLFLLGFLATHPVDRAWWYGVLDDETLRAAVMLLPGRLAVPWAPSPDDAGVLGEHLRSLHEPCMLVGPRAACDAIWNNWAVDTQPDRYYDQRLYVARKRPEGPLLSGFRRATERDLGPVMENAGVMEEEDLGRNPMRANPRLHEQIVRERVKAGRTWIVKDGRHVVFQINVGTVARWGVQVGGTYVPPRFRGRGWATRGMRALLHRLLPAHPMVTLHVNEANTAAVRVYEKSGFERAAPYRLVTVPTP